MDARASRIVVKFFAVTPILLIMNQLINESILVLQSQTEFLEHLNLPQALYNDENRSFLDICAALFNAIADLGNVNCHNDFFLPTL